MPKVEFTINGQPVTAETGGAVLQTAREQGIYIPSLCHNPWLKPYSACRVCLVEVAQPGSSQRRLTTSCDYPVLPGIAVFTDSGPVRRRRQMTIELLLARCPGAAELLELAGQLGFTPRRLPVAAHDLREKCILCGLCVRVCDEVVGAHALAFAGRGGRRRIATAFEQEAGECIGCGACEALCPTHCLSMERAAVRRFKEQWGATRWCRYALMGLLPGALCANDYECKNCETDQRMIARYAPVHPVFVARGLFRPGETVAQPGARAAQEDGT